MSAALTAMALSKALGGAINYFGSKNPAEAAMGYAQQVPETVTPYYQPYIDAGLRSLGTLEGEYGNLINNPNAVMSRMAGDIYGNNFQQSPGYQYQYNQAMNAQNNAAAAGGMLGSSAHQEQAANTANSLANQDFYNYLAHQMNIYNQSRSLYGEGLSGLSGLNTMGYGASNSLASILAENLMNMSELAGKSAQAHNSMLGGLVGSIF